MHEINCLGSDDNIVVFWGGKVIEYVFGRNRNEANKEVNLWVDTKEKVEEIWDKA